VAVLALVAHVQDAFQRWPDWPAALRISTLRIALRVVVLPRVLVGVTLLVLLLVRTLVVLLRTLSAVRLRTSPASAAITRAVPV